MELYETHPSDFKLQSHLALKQMMKQKMWTRSFSKVISLIVLYNQTVAAFDVALDVIGSVDNSPTLACGNNVIFMCSSTPVTDEMDWFMDNTNIATCKFGLCAPQVTIPTNVLFEYNVTKGIYNLTFTPILESNGAREYKCDFGLAFKSLTPTVTVFPDDSNSEITNSTSSNDINITASTCVSSSDLVSFKWYIFKAGESRKLFGTVPTYRMNESSCQSTSNCNGEMSTSTVTIKNLGEENGEYYYFQIEIIYDYSSDAEPHKVTINSPTQYKISGSSGNATWNNTTITYDNYQDDWFDFTISWLLGIFIGLVSVGIISIPIFFLCFCCTKARKAINGENKETNELHGINKQENTFTDLRDQNQEQ